MDFIKAFIIGGMFCVIGQILIDKTKLTPARILVCYVSIGAFLELFGVYSKLRDMAGAGASVPLTGFGSVLCTGVIKEIEENGALGILTGGISSAAAGIASALIFGFLTALIFKSKSNK